MLSRTNVSYHSLKLLSKLIIRVLVVKYLKSFISLDEVEALMNLPQKVSQIFMNWYDLNIFLICRTNLDRASFKNCVRSTCNIFTMQPILIRELKDDSISSQCMWSDCLIRIFPFLLTLLLALSF